ncbi:MAG: hypothetical protein JNM72_04745 [Deltaproteobacteria bacterium]|nr:hypothetical protein [Deltaproteobacteria bacterium]
MPIIERSLARLRLLSSAARAASGLPFGGPGALDLALRPGASAAELDRWLPLVADAVRWRGPVPVGVDAPAGADPVLAAGLLRFARRLDCPATLRWAGGALPSAGALALIDAGADHLDVLVGGSDDPNLDALAALVRARAQRGGGPTLGLAIRWRAEVLPSLAEVAQRALSLGVDRVELAPPDQAQAVPATERWSEVVRLDPARVRSLSPWVASAVDQMFAANDGEPGAPGGRRCPVGGARLELRVDGSACACPHKGLLWGVPEGATSIDLASRWAAAGAHRAAISACTRRCPALALRPPWVAAARGLARE